MAAPGQTPGTEPPPLEIEISGRSVTDLAQSTGAIERAGYPSGGNAMYFREPDRSIYYHPPEGTPGYEGRGWPLDDDELLAAIRKEEGDEEEDERNPRPPRPSSADPAPPEFIPDTEEAIAVCLSPDVCRAPQAPTPFMVYGRADLDRNYSPDVRSNGLVVKRANSVFTTTIGDEPGIGLGVLSGTVGSIVQPVTSSPTVFANGVPVQRHADRCTLNNGNCPGEYVHVRNDAVVAAPDATDEQERSASAAARAQAGQAIDGFYENSPEAQAAVAAWNRAGDYVGNPNLVVEDLNRLRESMPTGDEALQFGRDAARGARDVAGYVIDNPGQSARNVLDWGVNGLKGLWEGTDKAYQEGGAARAGGHLAAAVASAVNPFRKARAAGEAADALGDAGRAGRRDRSGNDGESVEGDGGSRSTAPPRVHRVNCFDMPEGLNAAEYDRQLAEQMRTINNMTGDDMAYAHWVLDRAGGTANLRVPSAQRAHRIEYAEHLADQGLSQAQIAARMSGQHATHFLDMVAGGHPTVFSRDGAGNPLLGDGNVNSDIGNRWTLQGRAASLGEEAERMRSQGRGAERMNVELKRC